jgi:hypothetical protein
MGNRLLVERPLPQDGVERKRGATAGRRPVRTVTVNLAESPLGWLMARGLVSDRQFDAGEQLRADWERAQLAPSVTMCWDAAPPGRNRAAPVAANPTETQFAAKQRFEQAIGAAGPAFATSSGGSSARARGCAMRSEPWAGQRAPAGWCSASRSTGWRITIG